MPLGFWIFAAAAVLAIGIGTAGPDRWTMEAMARRDAAVELAKHGASPLIVSCILDPPKFSNRCVEAMEREQK